MQTYLALGDSMSIDDYTGVAGGGAVNQFFARLGAEWTLDDRTCDGLCMGGVDANARGDLITLTIGGNDLLTDADRYLRNGLADFGATHASLLRCIRESNPTAALIVGDIYAPAAPLSDAEARGLAEANEMIHANCGDVSAAVAPIYATFLGRESEYLCLGIEPTLAGATAIARLFETAWKSLERRP